MRIFAEMEKNKNTLKQIKNVLRKGKGREHKTDFTAVTHQKDA